MSRGKSAFTRRQLRAAKKELRSLGIEFEGSKRGIANAARINGLVPESAKFQQIVDNLWLRGQKLSGEGLLSAASVSGFYDSPEWRKLAYRCKLRDGRRCMCCGATPADGVRIVSDHIVPIRARWDLRLNPDNIQTLCDDCNLGKGSRDATDFRGKADAQ